MSEDGGDALSSGLAVVGFRSHQPATLYFVIGKVVDKGHVVDLHAHLGERLARRSEIEQQYLFVAWRAQRLRRGATGQHFLVLRRWPAIHLAFAKAVQLGSGCKDVIEVAHVAVVHEIEIELECVGQFLDLGLGHSHDQLWNRVGQLRCNQSCCDCIGSRVAHRILGTRKIVWRVRGAACLKR